MKPQRKGLLTWILIFFFFGPFLNSGQNSTYYRLIYLPNHKILSEAENIGTVYTYKRFILSISEYSILEVLCILRLKRMTYINF